MDKSELQILLVVDRYNKFIGTITDGDIRRGLINGLSLDNSIDKITNKKSILVPPGTENNIAKNIMLVNSINQLPIVNENKKILGLYLLSDFLEKKKRKEPLVIMAGGKGLRLLPLTKTCPKPMLKIRGKPIIEWIIINAKKQGFENFFIITNYLSEVIEKYFKNEKKFGVKIKIIKENNFLGTFGGLIYLKKFLNTDFVLTNGDIVSEIKFDEILDFHKKSESDATMAVQINLHEIPFGIVQTNGSKIIKITEKPTQKNYINAGVYSFKHSVLKYLKTKNFINTTDFFNLLLKKKKKVNAFALHEDWIDIGIKENFDNLN